MDLIKWICILAFIAFIFFQTYWFDISTHEGILIISIFQIIESKCSFPNISLLRRIFISSIKSIIPLQCFLLMIGKSTSLCLAILIHKIPQNSRFGAPLISYRGEIRQFFMVLNSSVFAATFILRSSIIVVFYPEWQMQAIALLCFTEGVLVELISLFESVLDKESKRTEKLVLTSLKYSIVVVASVLCFRTGFDTNWKFVDYEEVEGKRMDTVYKVCVFAYFLAFCYLEYRVLEPVEKNGQIQRIETIQENDSSACQAEVKEEINKPENCMQEAKTKEQKNKVKKTETMKKTDFSQTQKLSNSTSKSSPLKTSKTIIQTPSKPINKDLHVVTSPSSSLRKSLPIKRASVTSKSEEVKQEEVKSSKAAKKVSKPLTSLYDRPTQSSIRRSQKQ